MKYNDYDFKDDELSSVYKVCYVCIIGILICIAISLFCSCNQCTRVERTSDTVYTERVDTLWKTDTIPQPVMEKVVRYVSVPVTVRDTIRDSVSLAVVQKEYMDSDYHAWVSGVAVDSFPRLDSISVKEKVITREITVTNTVIERKRNPRLSVGFVGGYGYGFKSREFEPFVGIGVSYRLFPK